MPLQTVCAACSIKIKVRDDLIGKAIKCPKCGRRLTVADLSRGAPPRAATAALAPAPPKPSRDVSDGTESVPIGGPVVTSDLATAPEPDGSASAPDAGAFATRRLPATADANRVDVDRAGVERATEFLGAPAPQVEAGRAATDLLSLPDARPSVTEAFITEPSVTEACAKESRPASVDSASGGATAGLAPPEVDSSATQDVPPASDAKGSLGGYRIVRRLGEGGMGAVYEAEDAKLHRHVALKIMKPEIARNAAHRERFLREARTAAKVKSDFICPIYRVGEDNDVPFIAMPLLHGESLDVRRGRDQRLPIDELVRIGKQVAQGLSVAHQARLVHRDIKPANIWLERQRSGPPRAIILDFGLARMQADDALITQSGAIIGTPAFMSPEQARGDKHVDARTDLFSLGCVLYALCTGQLPFQGDTTMAVLMALASREPTPPRKIVPEMPKALSRLILRLLAKDVDDRPQSATEVIDELVAIEAELAQPADAAFTTQAEAPLPPGGSEAAREPKLQPAEPTMLMRKPKARPRRRSLALYLILGLISLGILSGTLALAAGFVYYRVFAGGDNDKNQDPGPQAAAPLAAAPLAAAPLPAAPLPEPTGEVPPGWVVVNRGNYAVAMPQAPLIVNNNCTAQLPSGLALATWAQPIKPGDVANAGGPDQVLKKVMLDFLVNVDAVRLGAKVPDATPIALGPCPGKQIRLPAKQGAINGIEGGFIGIHMANAPGGGVRITGVTPDTPAARAGLKAGDIVHAIDGEPVATPPEFSKATTQHKAGDEVRLQIERDANRLEVKVTLAARAAVENYLRAYIIDDHFVILVGPARGPGPAPETTAFFNSLKRVAAEPVAQAEAQLPIHEVGEKLELQGKLDAQTASQVYRVKLAAGKRYTIDMVSPNPNALDPVLTLTDAAGKQLAQDDDSGGNLNARITYVAPRSGTYRIVVTAFNQGGTGPFTLTVETAKIAAREVGKEGFTLRGTLTAKAKGKVYLVQLNAGTTYVIDMVSANPQALDPMLSLTDSKGKELTQDDNGGGDRNARITFRPEQSGTYRIVATSAKRAGIGPFTLTVKMQVNAKAGPRASLPTLPGLVGFDAVLAFK